MKRRKKNLLRKTMAVLLSAILFIGGLPGNVADTSMAAEWETVSGNGGMVSPGEPDTVSGNSSVELPAGPGELDTVSGNDSLTMSRPVIIGWKFPDGAVSPQGDLFYEDGIYSLLLPGGDSEIQIPMEDIVGLLPESVTVEWSCQNFAPVDGQETGISAENLETGEKELAVAGWNCPEYTEDGEGILPCSGSFFFQAQLCGEEEYALGEDVAQIGVQVVFDEPMLLAVTAQPGRITSDQEWGVQTLQAGTYTIDPGVTVTVTGRLTVSGTVTINGGGTLARGYAGTTSSNGSNHCLLYVKGGTLTLENICVDGKEMTACGPAIYIGSGTVNLESGSVVQNNRNMNTGDTAGTYAGGGIYCDGTLNINGGSIRNNCTEATVGSFLYTRSGGAVYLKGICNMTSGSITGNTAANGGGIYLASTGATLNLSGGTIKDNHANGNGDGIFYSTYNNTTSSLRIGGNTNVADVIYLDNTKGSLCPSITSELKYPIRLACSSREEGKVLAMGSSYTLTGVDASKVSMAGTDLFSKLDKANNAIILSTTEELEATWQEASGGEWKKGKFTTALEKVYDGGTIKLLTDILLTQKAEITKQITITSDNPSAPCTMTRMPEGDWGNITLTGNGAGLRLTNIIYDGNRAFLSGNENAIQQSLIKVGSASDTAPTLTLGSGCVIRNGYKTDGSGVIAVYGTLIAENGSVIEDCEVTGTGGAIWISSAGKATLRGITVQNCRAGSGGSALSIDGTCTLESGVFKDNQDSSAKNCVIYLRNSGTGNLIITGTHRHLGWAYPIKYVGHGDLIETPAGEWYMTMLAVRPLEGYTTMGRETFLAKVTWENDWPVVNAGVGRLEEQVEISLPRWLPQEDPESYTSRSAGKNAVPGSDRHYDFTQTQTLGDEFLYLRNPDLTHYTLETGKGLYLTATSVTLKEKDSPTYLGIRQQHHAFRAEATLAAQLPEGCHAGMALLQSNAYHLRLEVAQSRLTAILCQNGQDTPAGSIELPEPEQNLQLYLQVNGLTATAGYKTQGQDVPIAQVDIRSLSTEVAGGFVGCTIGLYASREEATESKALFTDFSYCQESK